MPAPSYRRIAKACGVNSSTVSRALSNSPLIPGPTREHILSVARELGWKPNPALSAYVAHRRSVKEPQFHATLAYVIPFGVEYTTFADLPHYHRLHFEGAQQRAASLGYSLEKIWYRDVGFNARKLSRILKSRGIPGMLLYGQTLHENFIEKIDADAFAMASWGAGGEESLVHHASAHCSYDLSLALQRIREYGYSRISLVLSEFQDRLSGGAFFSGFYFEEQHHPERHLLSHLRFQWNTQFADLHSRIRGWLLDTEPEVVIGEGIVLETLQEMGWKVPEKVAFVSPFLVVGLAIDRRR